MFLWPAYNSMGAYSFSVYLFVPLFVCSFIRPASLCSCNFSVYQLLAHGQWFSPATPASSTTKTGRHAIAEILLKVALNTIHQIILIVVEEAGVAGENH
jgi:hypothetical protein